MSLLIHGLPQVLGLNMLIPPFYLLALASALPSGTNCLTITLRHKWEISMSDTTETKSQTRAEILQAALDGREQEIMHYQINIDNYTIALAEIGKMSAADQAELSAFEQQLRDLLSSETLEQKKSKLMLTVLKLQVE
jgi:hypothetical protein